MGMKIEEIKNIIIYVIFSKHQNWIKGVPLLKLFMQKYSWLSSKNIWDCNCILPKLNAAIGSAGIFLA